jgi:hypothetical protein
MLALLKYTFLKYLLNRLYLKELIFKRGNKFIQASILRSCKKIKLRK